MDRAPEHIIWARRTGLVVFMPVTFTVFAIIHMIFAVRFLLKEYAGEFKRAWRSSEYEHPDC